MAQTRGATGNAKPRILDAVSTDPGSRRAAKPKMKTSAGVTKKRAPATQKRKTSVKEKAAGATEKAVGSVARKPGKKAVGTKKTNGTVGKKSRTKKTATA